MKQIIILATIGALSAIAQQYTISTFAGGALPPLTAKATSLSVGDPAGGALDSAGGFYFTSTSLHCVFRLDPSGTLTRVAGTGRPGYSGDGGPGVNAQLSGPTSVVTSTIWPVERTAPSQ